MELEECYKKSKRYVNAVKKAIKDDYGCVPMEFDAQLVQLEDLYANYLFAASQVRAAGDAVTAINEGKTICVSAYFSTMLHTSKMMDKIVKSFGLNPASRKALKGSQPMDEDDCFSDL